MLTQYKKSTEFCRDNDVDNVSTEVSLVSHSVMVYEGADHQPVVIFTKYNMDSDKPVPVVNLPDVRFICGPSNQGKQANSGSVGNRFISSSDNSCGCTGGGGVVGHWNELQDSSDLFIILL